MNGSPEASDISGQHEMKSGVGGSPALGKRQTPSSQQASIWR